MKILIVDDEGAIRRSLERMLRVTGCRILQAGDGAEAMALVRTENPDLILTDVMMPTMTGVELVECLRAESNPVPVIVMSGGSIGHGAAGVKNLLATPGMIQGFVEKPFDPDVLLKLIGAQLGLNAT